MAALIETVAVVNKSGKAVSNTKHLVNVFKEAKAAYQERKAEMVANRQPSHNDEMRTRRALKATVEDDRSASSSRRRSGSHHDSSRDSQHQRRRSAGSVRSGSTSPKSIYPSSHNRFSQDLVTLPTRSPPRSPGMERSYTTQDGALALSHRKPVPARRSLTSPDIDMALAYGDLPGEGTISRSANREEELKPLVSKVKRLLEEADCLQYSATAIMTSLQKNPEAMAAVALTLAEISNIVSKMAPGALLALKSGAPAVFALLAAPEFLIAGGVALGVTVVAFGGYKIIKKIKAKSALDKEAAKMDEMLEIGVDMDSINDWRRGIHDYDDDTRSVLSNGTSVEGEFMTPQAAALSRLNLNAHEEVSQKSRSSSRASSSRSKGESESSKPSKGSSSKRSSKEKEKERKKKEQKVKKPSPLRLMFQ